MHGVDTANTVFTVLTLLANGALVLLVVAGLAAAAGGGPARRALDVLAPRAALLAAGIAVVTTLGSLYYSEIVGYLPCELCWFQRIVMYPLSAILVVGLLRRDRGAQWYAFPFVVIGAPLALYHWLIERVPSLASGSSCSAFVPCTVPYFQELGRLPNYPPSKWLKREKWPFKTVLADDARLRAFFGYGGQAFPYFVLFDAEGVVVARAEGELSEALIKDAAARLAAGEPIFATS